MTRHVNIFLQRYADLFRYLDESFAKMTPNASVVKFAPMVAPSSYKWRNQPFCQAAFKTITELIKERQHVNYDSYQPRNAGWMDRLGTHIRDPEQLRFFTDLFKQL